jgi:small nuclear ribonucleoprotein (snRNP)-like protein
MRMIVLSQEMTGSKDSCDVDSKFNSSPAPPPAPPQQPHQPSSSSSMAVQQQQQQQQQYVHQLLGRKIVCTLDDGRTVKGTFLCLDRLSNIILTNNVVEERTIDLADYRQYHSNNNNDNNNNDNNNNNNNDNNHSHHHPTLPMKRLLAQAMIPGSRLVKVEIQQSLHEQIMNSIKIS